MSNPFDQFASDFQSALPQVAPTSQPEPPPIGPQVGYPPQQQMPQQQMPQQQLYGMGTFPGQQPLPQGGLSNYEQQNPYEQPPPVGAASFSVDPYSTYVAPPPGQPIASLSSRGFSENPTVDAGNPFATSGLETVQTSYAPPNMPPLGQQYVHPVDFSQQPGSAPPMMPSAQPPSLESSVGQRQPPFPEANAYADPWGGPAPDQQPSYGSSQNPPFGPSTLPQDHNASAVVMPLQQSNPYAQPNQQQLDLNAGALVPSMLQSNPYAQEAPFVQPPSAYGPESYGPQAPPQQDPYGPQPGYGMPPMQDLYAQPQGYNQTYGHPPPQPQQQFQQPPPPPVDPFSVFESQSRALEAAPQATALVPYAGANPAASDDDFWGSFGANNPDPAVTEAPSEALIVAETKPKVEEEKKGEEGLPPGGEFYDARIFTPTLGVMFFKPQELTDSLFLNTDRDVVDALVERPVVAFIVEGSSARAAGVELGHVLLKVNGVDVKSPKEASRLIKEGPRPLPLLFYVPNTDVVTAEGEHMVKYDTRETTAPNSVKDWKPKYVVIGGIIAQPWMMNMYRSKSEYDIAVIETQARRPVSVKVKQFSLQGARIQNDWQGPQMVKYKNKNHPWKYIVVLPVARNPIKISSPNLVQLKPVHEGIRRVLLAQQRDRGGDGGGGGRTVATSTSSRTGEQYGRAYNGYSEDRGYAPHHDRGYAPQQAEATPRY